MALQALATAQTMTDVAADLDRIVREAEALRITGAKAPSTLWRWERDGRFPRRVRIGARAVGWRASELAAWVASRQAR